MLHLRTLGTLDLRRDDGTELLSVVSQPKRIGLLCYLALARPRGFHRRDTLLPLFWPEADDEHARASLRQAVHYLRRSLGEEVVLSRGDEELGLAAGEVSCDGVAFEEALEAGEPERALGLYQGELLPGLYVEGAPEFERWLEAERARLRERALKGAWALAESWERAGDAAGAARWAHRALELAPTDERMLRACMELLDRVGEAGAAGEAYEGYARRLREDYEVEPSAELRGLAEEIRGRGKRSTPRARPLTAPRAQPVTRPQPTPAPRPIEPSPSAAAAEASARATAPAPPEAPSPSPVAPPADATARLEAAAPVAPARPTRRLRRYTMIGLAALALAAVIVGFAIHSRRSHRPPAGERASIGVLPLTDVSPGHNQGYFADAVTSELIELLGKTPGVRVPGPTSSFLLKGKTLPLREIARQLGVTYVLEGTVLREGAHVRVTLRLSDALTDRQLSSLSYETPNGDQAEIQREVARYLAGRLAFDPGDLPDRSTTTPDAYDFFLQGVFALGDAPVQIVEGIQTGWEQSKAIELFQKSLALDPGFAAAWGRLARAYNSAGDFAAAKVAARRALALDSTQPDAHAALAGALGYGDWKWAEAEREIDRAIRFAPSAPGLYLTRASLRCALGRQRDAFLDLDRAEALAPVSTSVLINRVQLLDRAGRWQEELQTVQRIPGEDPLVRLYRFRAYAATGHRAEAAAMARAGGAGEVAQIVLRADPRQAVSYVKRRGPADPCGAADILDGVRAVAQAVAGPNAPNATTGAQWQELISVANELQYQCMERAVRTHHRWVGLFLRSRGNDSIRAQPRFQRLMREVGLPD